MSIGLNHRQSVIGTVLVLGGTVSVLLAGCSASGTPGAEGGAQAVREVTTPATAPHGAPATGRQAPRTLSQDEALADFDRVWQIVYDTHFDPTFNGVDWTTLGDEMRPRAAAAGTRTELRAIEQEMLDRLGQSHFAIIPGSAAEPAQAQNEPPVSEGQDETGTKPEALVPGDNKNREGSGDADTGIDLRIVDGRAVVWTVRPGSPAALAGVKTGWVLSGIRGQDVDETLDELRESLSAEELGIHAVALLDRRLRGPDGSVIDLEFLGDDDQKIEKEIQRAPMPGEFVKFGNLPPMSTHLEWSRQSVKRESGGTAQVGVITFNIWMIPIAPKFERAMYELRDCDGIIIDLRGNPGGVGALSSSLGRFLVSKKASLGTMKMRGAELSFNIEPVVVTTWGERLDPFAGPIAILQDAGSASTSEVFAGGLQSLGRVKVFGTRSAGMALPAGMDKLPSGDVLLHAIADFVTSTGARMEDGGVVPDVQVVLTRADLLDGIDAPKRAAMEWIAASTAPGAGTTSATR